MRSLLLALASLSLAAACNSDPEPAQSAAASDAASAGAGGGHDGGSSTGAGGSQPSCGDGAWVTYGHDGQRTSASDACIRGPLELLWSYSPAAPMDKMPSRLFHPLASKDAAFLHWSATLPPYTGTTAADRVSLDGVREWTFDSGTDTDFGDWASLWNDTLALNSDGVYLVDQSNGTGLGSTGVDWWGQTIPTPNALLFSNTAKADGPGVFVGALDDKAALLWKQNEQGTMCGDGFVDRTAGIALDGTTLFYAPLYASGSATPPALSSGLYAFDVSAMGKPLWNVSTAPASAISVGSGLVFGIEGTAGMTQLTARKQVDGSAAWSVDLPGAGVQAPALAGGKVLVATFSGINAFAQADGTPAWTNDVSAPAGANETPISNGCSGIQPCSNLPTTSIAVALGSGSVVAAYGKDLTVMSLATGETTWTMAQNVMGTLINPILVGDRLYVIDQAGPSGSLLALRSAPGK